MQSPMHLMVSHLCTKLVCIPVMQIITTCSKLSEVYTRVGLALFPGARVRRICMASLQTSKTLCSHQHSESSSIIGYIHVDVNQSEVPPLNSHVDYFSRRLKTFARCQCPWLRPGLPFSFISDNKVAAYPLANS